MKRVLGLGYRDPEGVRYVLGQIAEEQKLWPRAIEWYESIETGDHVMPARMRTANAIAKQGKLEEARAFLRRVAEENPEDAVQLTVVQRRLKLADAGRIQIDRERHVGLERYQLAAVHRGRPHLHQVLAALGFAPSEAASIQLYIRQPDCQPCR